MYRMINICHDMKKTVGPTLMVENDMNFLTVLTLISIVGTKSYHAELLVEF